MSNGVHPLADETTAPVHAISSQPGSEYYRLIDAARGIASLLVVLFHSLADHAAATLPPVLAGAQRVTQHGWLGVHVFFAISGWCIAERFAQARAKHETPVHFLADRAVRIFPAYWAAVLVALALRLSASAFNTTHWVDSFPSGPRAWLGTLLLLDPYLGSPPYLTVSWSLVYEVGFYVCAASALALLAWRRLDARVIFLLGAALCATPWLAPAERAPWIVLGLWPNFFVGVAAWCAVRRRARVAGYGLIAVIALLAFARPLTDSVGCLAAAATALALALLHPLDRRISDLRAVRWLAWCGGISYSLYLIHVPFMSAWENLATRRIAPSSPLFAIVWASAILLALGAGWMLSRGVENPLQRWRKRSRARSPLPA